ncbi:MAG: 23S rRNA (guanosine(2251)-2'-O)-methyltransferase RlmB [Candidatus Omnitrophica bacterium]|nr:23S rRNA (guanosine(2251)-2'-O)-methyltransferase RlmB [Candidatus Omnitrophota bacterium]
MKLFGKHQVYERIKANPKSIRKIFFQVDSNTENIRELARKKNISCEELNQRDFESRAQYVHAQGVMAEIEEFSYVKLEELLTFAKEEKITLLALSSITDPQNVGSILRSAACFGKFALIIPKHRSAGINETVLRVACGGENYVPVTQVTNLIPALKSIKEAGYWVVGTVVKDGEEITRFSLPFPLCAVIGSEDKGIRQGLFSELDFKVSLPMPGNELSLNAAVAAAIFCYEVIRQKNCQHKEL